MSTDLLFATAPYVALGCLLLVTVLRYRLASHKQRLTPKQRGLALRLFGRNRAWRWGMLGIVACHALMLLVPSGLLFWNQEPLRLMALEAVFFATGLVALLGFLALLRRYLADPPLRAYSSLADVALLALLAVQLLSGICMTVLYRWASSWSAVTLTPYLQSVALLTPRLALIEAMPYLVKLHVFNAYVIVAVLPFSHLIDLLLVPVGRVVEQAAARLVPLALAGQSFVVERVQQLLHVAIGPEEEDELG